jgi:hypothetical protein
MPLLIQRFTFCCHVYLLAIHVLARHLQGQLDMLVTTLLGFTRQGSVDFRKAIMNHATGNSNRRIEQARDFFPSAQGIAMQPQFISQHFLGWRDALML